jgi:hypothetical protein
MPYVFDHFEFDVVTLAHIGCEVLPNWNIVLAMLKFIVRSHSRHYLF